jgi:DNA-binding transcriptional LysR family regulator
MDIKKIRNFIVVAENNNISNAAEILYMSQPHLSRQIKEMEIELGVLLFERVKGGVQLTRAGQLFYSRCLLLLDVYDSIINDMQDIANEEIRSITFGSIDMTNLLVEPIYKKLFKRTFKNGKIQSVIGTSEEVTEKLISKEINIAFVRYPFKGKELFDTIILYREGWCALMADNFPVPDEWGDEITLEQLNRFKLILPTRETLYLPLVCALSVNSKKPNIFCYYFNKGEVPMLARQSQCIAIVPRSIDGILNNKDRYILKTIKGLNLETGYMAIKLKDQFNSNTVREFWSIIRSYKLKI